jgi:osmotically-inducible protein OsmY
MKMTNLLVLFGTTSPLFSPTISMRPSNTGDFIQTVSRNAEHSDSWIRARVKATLLFRRHLNTIGTTVHVNDGVVTILGAARDSAEKSLITSVVARINGVTRVINNLTLNITTSYGD